MRISSQESGLANFHESILWIENRHNMGLPIFYLLCHVVLMVLHVVLVFFCVRGALFTAIQVSPLALAAQLYPLMT